MGIFKDVLSSDESLFKNTIALDYDYVPKIVPYREAQQRYIASCIKPLLASRNGRNILVHGVPGVGKTVAVKNIFQEIEEETDDVYVVYINCWQKNTSYKIMLEICDILGYRLTVNKRTDELFKIVKSLVNKKSVVFCFDEADKIEDFDFLYMILEEVYRKSIILITNYLDWLVNLDSRIKSRLTPDTLEFKFYTKEEIRGILTERMNFAFHQDVWDKDAFEIIVSKTIDIEDVRSGLYLMKEAGSIAELDSSKKILAKHAEQAIEKLDEFTIKNTSELESENRMILSVVKKNPGSKLGDLYKQYAEQGGKGSYKTFQRRVAKLAQGKFVKLTKTVGGSEGSHTIVDYISATGEKKLTDY